MASLGQIWQGNEEPAEAGSKKSWPNAAKATTPLIYGQIINKLLTKRR
jgi:hypothetical protein